MNEWNQYFESYNENLGSQTDIGTQVQFSSIVEICFNLNLFILIGG